MRLAHDLRKAVSKLPACGSFESAGGVGRETPTVKLFTPDAHGTWFLTEYDPEDAIAFGLCDLGFPELGSVSIEELETVRGPLGLHVEVDLYWKGTLADGYKALGKDVPTWLRKAS